MSYDKTMDQEVIDEMRRNQAEAKVLIDRMKAREPVLRRLMIEAEIAAEQLHRAVQALSEATPR